MFDVLVYLYETYYRPDACPDSEALVKKLSAVGFEEDEISRALGWLTDLAEVTNALAQGRAEPGIASSTGMRFYAQRELDVLGTEAIGFLQFLEAARIVDSVQREIIIERALAAAEGEGHVSLDKFKVIVLMVMWSQGKEPDGLIFDELFMDEDELEPRLLH